MKNKEEWYKNESLYKKRYTIQIIKKYNLSKEEYYEWVHIGYNLFFIIRKEYKDIYKKYISNKLSIDVYLIVRDKYPEILFEYLFSDKNRPDYWEKSD